MKRLPSPFSCVYSRVKLFVFAMNRRRRYSISVGFIYGLEEKNWKSEVVFAVCCLPLTSCVTSLMLSNTVTSQTQFSSPVSQDTFIGKLAVFRPWKIIHFFFAFSKHYSFITYIKEGKYFLKKNLVSYTLKPSLFLYGLLLSLWCFSILVNYFLQVSFNLKVILNVAKITQTAVIELP